MELAQQRKVVAHYISVARCIHINTLPSSSSFKNCAFVEVLLSATRQKVRILQPTPLSPSQYERLLPISLPYGPCAGIFPRSTRSTRCAYPSGIRWYLATTSMLKFVLATVVPCLTPNINQGFLSGRIFQTSWQSFTGCYANTLPKSNCSTQCAYVPTIRLSTSTLKFNLLALTYSNYQ